MSQQGIRRLFAYITIEYIALFFFQAEDGIRDKLVTGVQTCALPIFERAATHIEGIPVASGTQRIGCGGKYIFRHAAIFFTRPRSEERRVGKECRSRWSPYH